MKIIKRLSLEAPTARNSVGAITTSDDCVRHIASPPSIPSENAPGVAQFSRQLFVFAHQTIASRVLRVLPLVSHFVHALMLRALFSLALFEISMRFLHVAGTVFVHRGDVRIASHSETFALVSLLTTEAREKTRRKTFR